MLNGKAQEGSGELDGLYVVTGGGGFIGSHMIQRLASADRHVLALDIACPDDLPEGVEFASCDIRHAKSVAAALLGREVAFGIHLAGKVGDWGPREEFEAVNVAGTRHVLEALVAAGASQILHVSSIAAMGYDPGMEATELVPPQAAGDPYSDTKAAGEMVAMDLQASGAPITIIRPGDVFGPGSTNWVTRPLDLIQSGKMILVDGGSGHFGHVYVDNLLEGMLLALSQTDAIGQTYILTDAAQNTTFKTYFGKLALAVGSSPPRVSIPKSAAMALGAAMETAARTFDFGPWITRTAVRFITKHCSYSIVKAVKDLGYAPTVTLDEGIRRIAVSYGVPT